MEPCTSSLDHLVAAALLLLGVSFGVALLARWTRVPYPVALVIAGVALRWVPHLPQVTLTPHLILMGFLPALLFDGGWRISLSALRRAWLPVALYAVVGVVVGIGVTQALLIGVAHLDPMMALLFSCIVVATDPIAVLAVFRTLHVDRHLSTILEGESLFNDATAVIAFAVVTSVSIRPTLDVLHITQMIGMTLIQLIGIGLFVGALIGAIASWVLRSLDEYLIEASGTTLVAYGAYLLAESLHGSGVLAVITAALVLSSIGRRVGVASTTRQAVDHYWEFVAFLANSALFVMVGLRIDIPSLFAAGHAVAWAFVAISLGRVSIIVLFGRLSTLLGSPVPPRWFPILSVGGLRGALAMALVLSLPPTLPHRAVLVSMVFAVVAGTLIVQGLAITPLLRFLSLQHSEELSAR